VAIIYIGLFFAVFIAAMVGLLLAVMAFEARRHRRGFDRVADVIGGEVALKGRHAKWQLWGLDAVVDECQVEIQAAVSNTSVQNPAGQVGLRRYKLLATRVRATDAAGHTVEQWADLPTSRRRVASVIDAARAAVAELRARQRSA
jgi:hypothetical protein